MISKETIDGVGASQERGWLYILGARMRAQKEVNDEVLGSSRALPRRASAPNVEERRCPSPLDVKEVWVGDRRYVVCRNQDEARKDAADREAIVASLREQLRAGDKSSGRQ